MAIDVTLTIIETQHAAMVGAMRHIEATKRRLANRFGADPDNGWTLNIEGAAGELAVAKVLNRYWEMPINTFRQGGDVGSLQVRTRSQHQFAQTYPTVVEYSHFALSEVVNMQRFDVFKAFAQTLDHGQFRSACRSFEFLISNNLTCTPLAPPATDRVLELLLQYRRLHNLKTVQKFTE